MYVFTSALFFLIIYSIFHAHGFKGSFENKKSDILVALPDSVKAKALANAKNKNDSTAVLKALDLATPYMRIEEDGVKRSDTTGHRKTRKSHSVVNITDLDREYASIPEYDSIQKTLPAKERDNWIERKTKHRQIELNERYKGDKKAMWKDLVEKFTHTFPYLLFVSLPLYAFYLMLLYYRRKQFLYVTHGIFLIYLYIFTFIDLLVYFGLNQIHESMNWDWVGWIEAAVLLYGVWYAYKAMRIFYGQGRGKTILKFFILNTLAFCSIIFLFTAFFLFAVFKF
jgi:hypothetical protein